MKPLLLLLLLSLVGSSALADHPAIVSSGFINENAPYPECHASTIVETSPGNLVAAWFGGTKERNPDVCIFVAKFENGRWTTAHEVANGIVPNGKRMPTWNPVLFQPTNGPLVLFYKVGPSPREWWGMMTTSSDEGTTWSTPKRLPDRILGPIKNKPVQLADGAWLSPSSTEGANDSKPDHGPTEGGWLVHFELSRRGQNLGAHRPSVERCSEVRRDPAKHSLSQSGHVASSVPH